MKVKLLNVIVFAEKYEELIEWYKNALSLTVLFQETGEYHYTELGFDNQVIVGITPASEIKHSPINPRNNSSIMQVQVSDINSLFKSVSENGGEILFGPSLEDKYNFYYGGIADCEGNQIWIVEEQKL